LKVKRSHPVPPNLVKKKKKNNPNRHLVLAKTKARTKTIMMTRMITTNKSTKEIQRKMR